MRPILVLPFRRRQMDPDGQFVVVDVRRNRGLGVFIKRRHAEDYAASLRSRGADVEVREVQRADL